MLKDFARYCENDKICRRLRDLTEKFRTARRSIVLTGAKIELPADLDGDALPFQLGLPEAEDLLPGVKQVLADRHREQRIPISLDLPALTQLTQNLVGLPEGEALRALRKSVLARGKADAALLDAVLETKREALEARGTDRDSAAGRFVYRRRWPAASSGLDCKAKKCADGGRAPVRTSAAKGRADYRRAGLREEPGRRARWRASGDSN